MPLYEYECKKCHHRVERIVKFSDPPLKKCPKCGGPVEQLISAPAVQFKGSGWYVTDYAKKSGASASNGDSGEKGESSSKDESKEKDKSAKAETSKDESSTKSSGKDSGSESSTTKKESKAESPGKKKASSEKKS